MPITSTTTQSGLSFPSQVELSGADTACLADGEWAYTHDSKTTWRLDRTATSGGVETPNHDGRWLPFDWGSFVEVLVATDPAAHITLTPYGTSILENTTGGAYSNFNLPDGIEGMRKTIVAGSNTHGAPIFMAVNSTNNSLVLNDWLDFNTGVSVSLVWVTERGGWVATSYSQNVNLAWD